MNCANAYFWAGKTFAAQYFTAVPFGFNFQGMNAWLYHGGGMELWEEVYAPFNLVPMPMGNTGVQMTGWFKKPIEKVDDFKGLKMRIPGLAGRVYASLGVDVKLLPAGEIFPALERGVIDAAEFVGPYQDRRLGLHKAAKFYYTTGWHESSTVTELSSTRRPGIRFRPTCRRSSSPRPPPARPSASPGAMHQCGGPAGAGHQAGREDRAAAGRRARPSSRR